MYKLISVCMRAIPILVISFSIYYAFDYFFKIKWLSYAILVIGLLASILYGIEKTTMEEENAEFESFMKEIKKISDIMKK